jgi:hypothetical protein
MAVKRRRRRASGDLCQLKVELWAGIRYLVDTIENAKQPAEVRLRACAALPAAGVYRQILEGETTTLNERQALALMGQLVDVIKRHVGDERILRAIAHDIERIAVERIGVRRIS